MDVNDKVTALEDELKLLKAEIRNVLLDIREVVLERKNPLAEENDSAHITLDVNTTARAMASEAAGAEARKATDAAAPQPADATSEPTASQPEPIEAPAAEAPAQTVAELEPGPDLQDEPEAEISPESSENIETAQLAPESRPEDEPPAVVATLEPDMSDDTTDIPEMFMADLQPLSGDGSLADWVTNAIDTVGVDDLSRVITMFRLWGNVPPNINRALAHLQALLASTNEPQPAWLEVLQDLDRLASL